MCWVINLKVTYNLNEKFKVRSSLFYFLFELFTLGSFCYFGDSSSLFFNTFAIWIKTFRFEEIFNTTLR